MPRAPSSRSQQRPVSTLRSRRSSARGRQALERPAWVDAADELDLVSAPQLGQTLREAQPHARVVVLEMPSARLNDAVATVLQTMRSRFSDGSSQRNRRTSKRQGSPWTYFCS
jgi:hypothetical protein